MRRVALFVIRGTYFCCRWTSVSYMEKYFQTDFHHKTVAAPVKSAGNTLVGVVTADAALGGISEDLRAHLFINSDDAVYVMEVCSKPEQIASETIGHESSPAEALAMTLILLK